MTVSLSPIRRVLPCAWTPMVHHAAGMIAASPRGAHRRLTGRRRHRDPVGGRPTVGLTHVRIPRSLMSLGRPGLLIALATVAVLVAACGGTTPGPALSDPTAIVTAA